MFKKLLFVALCAILIAHHQAEAGIAEDAKKAFSDAAHSALKQFQAQAEEGVKKLKELDSSGALTPMINSMASMFSEGVVKGLEMFSKVSSLAGAVKAPVG